ncbi:DMT family transporter [Teredinibacter waterburyi]|uniref:DMT family transporter n=1 Tax=Teredinibacter waterburyi TaxID=1500538 RepID=UPI00165FAD20|nr:DMT family transporter [Teredinibacter waterburyi]
MGAFFSPSVMVLLGASVLWGCSWYPLRLLNQSGIEAVPLLLVGQGLLALLFTPKGLIGVKLIRHWRPLVGIFICGGSAILCFTCALIYGDVIRVMVLFYLLPVWGVLGGCFFLEERLDWRRTLGVVLALGGAFFILGGLKIFESPPGWIDLLALASGLFFAANNLMFRGVERLPLTTKLVVMFYGCAVIAGLLLLAGVQSFPSSYEPEPWLWLGLYSVTWLLFANLGSQWAVTQMEAGQSSIIIIMELVAAVISAMLLAGERLSTIEWLGCVLVICAAVLESLRAQPATTEKLR